MNIDLVRKHNENICEFIFENLTLNRKKLFEKALKCARDGKVLYILQEELNELPELSQDLNLVNRHYMKMISFVYTKSIDLLLESISNLLDWQNIPRTIILDNLNGYCTRNDLQKACGIVALLLDTVNSCSASLNTTCYLYISVDRNSVGDDYCFTLQELYNFKM